MIVAGFGRDKDPPEPLTATAAPSAPCTLTGVGARTERMYARGVRVMVRWLRVMSPSGSGGRPTKLEGSGGGIESSMVLGIRLPTVVTVAVSSAEMQ